MNKTVLSLSKGVPMKKENATAAEAREEFRYTKPCSAQDCTGLIPSGPVDEAEIENYEELYPFLPKIPKDSG